MTNFRLIVKKNGIFNIDLLNIYMKNYGKYLIFYSLYKYCCVSESYLWFTLVDGNDEIIGECSIANRPNKKSTLRTFEFHDVFVQEKFRGNNYAELMLLNVLDYLDKNYNYFNYIIKTDNNNYPAIKTYTKICGKPVYKNRLAIFEYNQGLNCIDIQ